VLVEHVEHDGSGGIARRIVVGTGGDPEGQRRTDERQKKAFHIVRFLRIRVTGAKDRKKSRTHTVPARKKSGALAGAAPA